MSLMMVKHNRPVKVLLALITGKKLKRSCQSAGLIWILRCRGARFDLSQKKNLKGIVCYRHPGLAIQDIQGLEHKIIND